ncbi:glycosyltransferase family 4 protein [Alicyclobacillus fastidiosus]|uniref:Glycosyltransferase family 4 protein n=1 Tax=Alicyclobacillus fastidiosus TaxID=392011 RepID=A0ABV5A9F3_9BACL|nr:glycosyltransferase family 4 protein [Alicyclobacillus fastidiosus]WEH10832.1 glycosyltransferase family 4 protein [Alicyclobacillus fastidiosus]
MRTVFVFFAGNERGGAAAHIHTLARTVVRFGNPSRYRFVSLGSGPLADAIATTDVRLHKIEGGTLAAVSQLRQLLQTEREVLLHAHGPRMNILAALATRRRRVPWTSTIHSHPAYDFLGSSLKSRIYPKLHMWSLKQAMGLFIVQSSLAEVLPTRTVLDVPNAVDLPPLPRGRAECAALWRDRLGIEQDARLVGVAARFDPVKNLDVLIRAMAHLQTQNAHLLLAGDGEMRPTLEQLAVQEGVANRVHFLGFLNGMADFYGAIEIHVLPSKSEGTPFCVLEAGTYGVANIGSDIPGLRALLQDGRAGVLAPVGDVGALAKDIDILLQNEAERAKYVDAFSQRVLPDFAPQKMLEAYERGYTVLEEDILRSRQFTRSS